MIEVAMLAIETIEAAAFRMEAAAVAIAAKVIR
jgi:hypothetical protein